MGKALTSRIGEKQKNKQGLTMKIVKYINNKNIEIRFVETGEKRKTTYLKFRRGTVTANLLDYPVGNECTFRQAKWVTLGFLILAGATIGAIIYASLS